MVCAVIVAKISPFDVLERNVLIFTAASGDSCLVYNREVILNVSHITVGSPFTVNLRWCYRSLVNDYFIAR